MYLFEVPVIALQVYACHDGQGVGGFQETSVILPGNSEKGAMQNFYKIYELSVKERPKIGITGMLWIDRKKKIKKICSDPLLRKNSEGKFFCSNGCICTAIGPDAIGRCQMVDSLGYK